MNGPAGEVVAFGIMQSRFGKADDLMDMLRESLNETLKMEGVKEAYISQAMDDPNRFFTYSRWHSLAAYDRMQQDYASRQQEMGLPDLLEGAPVWGAYMIMQP